MSKQLDLEQIKTRLLKAHDMVNALCQPRGRAGTREWVMSIPARPEYDPDLVIGSALYDANKLLDELERTRGALTSIQTACDDIAEHIRTKVNSINEGLAYRLMALGKMVAEANEYGSKPAELERTQENKHE